MGVIEQAVSPKLETREISTPLIDVKLSDHRIVAWGQGDDLLRFAMPNDLQSMEMHCITPQGTTSRTFGAREASAIAFMTDEQGVTSFMRLQQAFDIHDSTRLFGGMTKFYNKSRPDANIVVTDRENGIVRLAAIPAETARITWNQYVSNCITIFKAAFPKAVATLEANNMYYDYLDGALAAMFGIPYSVLRLQDRTQPDAQPILAWMRGAGGPIIEHILDNKGISPMPPSKNLLTPTDRKIAAANINRVVPSNFNHPLITKSVYSPDTWVTHGVDEESEIASRILPLYERCLELDKGLYGRIKINGVTYSALNNKLRHAYKIPTHIIAHVDGELEPRILATNEFYEVVINSILKFGGFIPLDLLPEAYNTHKDNRAANNGRLNDKTMIAWQRPFLDGLLNQGIAIAGMPPREALTNYVSYVINKVVPKLETKPKPFFYEKDGLKVTAYADNAGTAFHMPDWVPLVIEQDNQPKIVRVISQVPYRLLARIMQSGGYLDWQSFTPTQSWNTYESQFRRMAKDDFDGILSLECSHQKYFKVSGAKSQQ